MCNGNVSKMINYCFRAKKESFSLYGQLFCLNGELVPNLLISAKGTGNCSEYGEEGLSDESGNFRIWALKSSVRLKFCLNFLKKSCYDFLGISD